MAISTAFIVATLPVRPSRTFFLDGSFTGNNSFNFSDVGQRLVEL